MPRMFLKSMAVLALVAMSMSDTRSWAREEQSAIPDLSSLDVGWTKTSRDLMPPESGPGPVSFDKAHPYTSNYLPRVADAANPNLKPWVADRLRKYNEDALSGMPRALAQSQCLPGGVLQFFIYGGIDTIYFVQGPKEILIIDQADEQIRHVYLNVPHSPHPALSWYGESVGHYENGELVVDTIGLSDRTDSDNYGTPHTNRLHVVERFQLSADRQTLKLTVTAEDPDAFNMPWSGVMVLKRSASVRRLEEQPCAENNFNPVTGKANPFPVAEPPDF